MSADSRSRLVQHPPAQQRLLADAMLGKLTRWLRILGLDTLYDPEWDDPHIVRLARAEQRLVLTRDRRLSQMSGIDTLLIESDQLSLQLQQVLARLGAPSLAMGTRCSVCNGRLEEASIDQVHDRIPPYVRANYSAFRRCPTCDRIYWQGGHWRRMRQQIDRLLHAPDCADEPNPSSGSCTGCDTPGSTPLD